MGQLLSNLSIRGNDGTTISELGFNIEHVSPTEDERALYEELHALLVRPTSSYLDRLRAYTDPDAMLQVIKENSPDQNLRVKAGEALKPTVEMLSEFYEYSKELQASLPRLLEKICNNNHASTEQYPGLTRLFAEVLDFAFEFDYIKMLRPTILNNLSFYGRIVGQDAKVPHDIPLFFGYPTPMLDKVIEVTTAYAKKNNAEGGASDYLARLWGTCYLAVSRKRNEQQQKPSEDIAFHLKAMVVCIVLYDNINPIGAFCKRSPINIKNSVKVIQVTGNLDDKSSMRQLMPALQNKSKHLKDDTTPKSTRNLVMA